VEVYPSYLLLQKLKAIRNKDIPRYKDPDTREDVTRKGEILTAHQENFPVKGYIPILLIFIPVEFGGVKKHPYLRV